MPQANKPIVAVVLLCVACSAQRKGSEKLAAQLLEISGIHLIYAEGIVTGYRNSAAADKKPEKEISCFVTKITPELVLPVLASAYAVEFSDSELDSAISFFGSTTGKEYVRYQRIKSKEMFGVSTTEKAPQFSSHDLELIDSFAETRIGKLILSPHSPMSASARAALRPQLIAFRDQCKR